MIEKITIKNIATFDSMGIVIDKLKKVNFIYGTNGSGKTTISNVLCDAGTPEKCEVVWENAASKKFITYNKLFREAHFNKGKIPGVFTLGNATKEQLAKIEQLHTQLSKLKDEDIQKKKTIEALEGKEKELVTSFQETCWTGIYKQYEDIFNPAFDGYKSKERFQKKIVSEYQSNKYSPKSIEELKSSAKTIFGDAPRTMEEISLIDYMSLTAIEGNTIWDKKIIGKSDIQIAKLIQRLNINDWVNQGREYIEINSEICPFCQSKTIENDFRTQLEAYFDETFVADTNLIGDLNEKYVRAFEKIVSVLQNIETIEFGNKKTKLNISLFGAYLKTLNQQYLSNKERLKNKLKEPSRSIELVSTTEQLELSLNLIATANVEIKKHNQIVDNFITEKSNLIAEVWKFLIEENKAAIDNFSKQITGLQKGIESLKKEKKELKNQYREKSIEIVDANKNVTSIQPSIDAINATLSSYGFENFKIVPSNVEANYYQIEREDGTIAEKTLSEGEVTFITFLYFLQLAKGGLSVESISEERILVIDDPISSLDSNVLFVVSSLIKEIIKATKKGQGNIKQVIILTHNVYFHKEVTYVDQTDNNRDDISYWILRKNKNKSAIQHYVNKNPIRGSYELLWDELKQERISRITVQNSMRRILEAYFKTMGKYKNNELLDKFENSHEKEICRSLLCWINDGSHCIPDDLFIEVSDEIALKYNEVFKKIFQQMGHIEHYNMMLGGKKEEDE